MKSNKDNARRLVLLDVHAILHRAYHALPDFKTKAGEPTGGLYGLIALLLKLVNDLAPDHIIACYDRPEPTFRDAVYKEYKAGRAKTDDDLVLQIKRSYDVFRAFNIPVYEAVGFEADDIIGTLAHQAKNKRAQTEKANKENSSATGTSIESKLPPLDVVIASGDMDTLQLVDKKSVQVYTLRKGLQDTILYDEDKVRERFGFGPELLPDYKGLRGDPSDNIPGVVGIGEKTATILITEFGTLENLYKELNREGTEKEPEARKKAKGKGGRKDIKTNASTESQEGEVASVSKFESVGIKLRIQELLRSSEDEALFSKMLATIRLDAPVTLDIASENWKEGVDMKVLAGLMQELEFRTLLERARATLLPKGTDKEGKVEGEIDGGSVAEIDAEIDEASEEYKAAQIALWLLDSTESNPTISLMREMTEKMTLSDCKEELEKRLHDEGLEKVYREIELPIMPILRKAEARGILLNVPYLSELSGRYHKVIAEIERNIYGHAGREFNINSPKQLGLVLYDEMGLWAKGLKKTAGGARSTRESELEKLRGEHAIIDEIMQYREIGKLLSTYIDTLPKLVDEGSRIHTSMRQTGTTTGRMSSDSPNMQNIPTKGAHGSEVREAFLSTPKDDPLGDKTGYLFAAFDYSQIEMRLLAVLSCDRHLVETFKEGRDVHASVASRVFGVAEEDVTADMRRRAKVINFGIVYGMGVNALRANLGTTQKEAREFYDGYFTAYPTIMAYFDKVKNEARKKGYTETLFGRRRYLSDLKSHIPFVRAAAERMAMNAPIQGTATGDIIKIAIKRADDALKAAKLDRGSHLLLQVHDELLFELRRDSHLEQKIAIIKEAMEQAVTPELLREVPLTVDVKVGEKWGSLTAKH